AAVAVLVVVAGVVVFIKNTRSPAYQTEEVRRGAITEEVLASGNVASPDTIDLQFQNTGTLVAIDIEPADKVRKGEVLARLDTAVLEAERSKATSSLAAQKAQLTSLVA